MAARRGVRFKASDIWDAPDDEYRYEVIDGELFMTPPPTPAHQGGAGNLLGYLWQHMRSHRLGQVYPAPIGVVLDEETAVQPDVVYLSHQRLSLISARGIEGPPDLVVEVLSPSTEARDRGIKLRRYAAAGIRTTGCSIPGRRASRPTDWVSRGTSLRAPMVRAPCSARSCSPIWRSRSTTSGSDEQRNECWVSGAGYRMPGSTPRHLTPVT